MNRVKFLRLLFVSVVLTGIVISNGFPAMAELATPVVDAPSAKDAAPGPTPTVTPAPRFAPTAAPITGPVTDSVGSGLVRILVQSCDPQTNNTLPRGSSYELLVGDEQALMVASTTADIELPLVLEHSFSAAQKITVRVNAARGFAAFQYSTTPVIGMPDVSGTSVTRLDVCMLPIGPPRPTSTPMPVPTNTPTPLPTSTPTPVPTNTPTPTAVTCLAGPLTMTLTSDTPGANRLSALTYAEIAPVDGNDPAPRRINIGEGTLPYTIEIGSLPCGDYDVFVRGGVFFAEANFQITVDETITDIPVTLRFMSASDLNPVGLFKITVISCDPSIANALPAGTTWTVMRNGREVITMGPITEPVTLPLTIPVSFWLGDSVQWSVTPPRVFEPERWFTTPPLGPLRIDGEGNPTTPVSGMTTCLTPRSSKLTPTATASPSPTPTTVPSSTATAMPPSTECRVDEMTIRLTSDTPAANRLSAYTSIRVASDQASYNLPIGEQMLPYDVTIRDVPCGTYSVWVNEGLYFYDPGSVISVDRDVTHFTEELVFSPGSEEFDPLGTYEITVVSCDRGTSATLPAGTAWQVRRNDDVVIDQAPITDPVTLPFTMSLDFWLGDTISWTITPSSGFEPFSWSIAPPLGASRYDASGARVRSLSGITICLTPLPQPPTPTATAGPSPALTATTAPSPTATPPSGECRVDEITIQLTSDTEAANRLSASTVISFTQEGVYRSIPVGEHRLPYDVVIPDVPCGTYNMQVNEGGYFGYSSLVASVSRDATHFSHQLSFYNPNPADNPLGTYQITIVSCNPAKVSVLPRGTTWQVWRNNDVVIDQGPIDGPVALPMQVDLPFWGGDSVSLFVTSPQWLQRLSWFTTPALGAPQYDVVTDSFSERLSSITVCLSPDDVQPPPIPELPTMTLPTPTLELPLITPIPDLPEGTAPSPTSTVNLPLITPAPTTTPTPELPTMTPPTTSEPGQGETTLIVDIRTANGAALERGALVCLVLTGADACVSLDQGPRASTPLAVSPAVRWLSVSETEVTLAGLQAGNAMVSVTGLQTFREVRLGVVIPPAEVTRVVITLQPVAAPTLTPAPTAVATTPATPLATPVVAASETPVVVRGFPTTGSGHGNAPVAAVLVVAGVLLAGAMIVARQGVIPRR